MFMVVGENADFMKADLLPDKTYYALVRPRMGWWKARFSLSPIRQSQLDSEEFIKWNGDCDLMNNTEESYQWAKENEASLISKREKYLPAWKAKSESARLEATLFQMDGR
jgi:hypothetical protein